MGERSILPEKDGWNACEAVIERLNEEASAFTDWRKEQYAVDEITWETYVELLPLEIELADEIMGTVDPAYTEVDPGQSRLVDLGSGIGTFAAISAAMGIDSVGIEREKEPYERAEGLSDDLDVMETVPGDLEYVHGDFMENDTWDEVEQDIDDFSIIVAYLPGEKMDETLDYLRESGPSDAVYIFPQISEAKNVEGFESSSLNDYFEREGTTSLGTPVYEKEV